MSMINPNADTPMIKMMMSERIITKADVVLSATLIEEQPASSENSNIAFIGRIRMVEVYLVIITTIRPLPSNSIVNGLLIRASVDALCRDETSN